MNKASSTQKYSFKNWWFKRKANIWSINEQSHTSSTFFSWLCFISLWLCIFL